MCRLCALTNLKYNLVKAQVLDRCTLMGMGDTPAQRDGWGVSNGEKHHKARGAYRSYNQTSWMEDFEKSTSPIWISHVRQASTGTALSDDEAHPFVFSHFHAAHNGTLHGTYNDLSAEELKGRPSSDSWRAFFRLNSMLEAGETIDSALEPWLNRYEDSSAFVFFLITPDQKLHIIRGPKTRDMYYAPFGDGFIFNTDRQVILASQEHLRYLVGETHEGDKAVKEFPEFSYAVVSPGKQEFDSLRQFTWEPKRSYAVSHWPSASTPRTVTPNNNSVANRQNSGGRWIKIISEAVKLEEEKKPLLEAWVKLRQALSPMREPLALQYCSMILRSKSRMLVNATSYDTFLLSELELLLTMVTKNSDWTLTDEHKKNIHEWNLKVPADEEDTLLLYLGMDEATAPWWRFEGVQEWLDTVKVETSQ